MYDNMKSDVLECLRQLASIEFQERVWVRGEGPEVSSFVEAVCGLFDDTGLNHYFESGEASAIYGEEAERELKRLSRLIDEVPPGLEHAEILGLPVWEEVMKSAARAADLISGG